MGPHISIGKVNGTKIGKKNLGKKVDFIFKHGPIHKKIRQNLKIISNGRLQQLKKKSFTVKGTAELFKKEIF